MQNQLHPLTLIKLLIINLITLSLIIPGYGNSASNISSMPWMTNPPILHKQLGVVLLAPEPVYAPIAQWNHIVKLRMPCIQSVLSDDTFQSIQDSYSVVTDMLLQLSNINKTGTIRSTMHVLEFKQQLIKARIKSVLRIIMSVQSEAQYGWGLIPKSSCGTELSIKTGYLKDEIDHALIHQRTKRSLDSTTKDSRFKRHEININHVDHFHMQSGSSIDSINQDQKNEPQKDESNRSRFNQVRQGSNHHHIHKIQSTSSRPYDTPNHSKSNPTYFESSNAIKSSHELGKHIINNPSVSNEYDILKQESTDFLGDQSITKDESSALRFSDDYSSFNHLLSQHISKHHTNMKIKVCESKSHGGSATLTTCDWYYIRPDLEHPKPLQHYYRRSKRGICNFCGKIIRNLYGTATVNDVQEALLAMKSDFSEQGTIINQFVSQQSAVIIKLNERLTILDKTLGEIQDKFHHIKDIANVALDKTIKLQDQLDLNTVLSYIHISLSTLLDYVNIAKDGATNIKNWYQLLKASIQHQIMDIELVSGSSLSKISTDLQLMIPAHLEIIPSWSEIKSLGKNRMSVFTSDHDLIFMLHIPLRKITNTYKAWTLHSLPFPLIESEFRTDDTYATTRVKLQDGVMNVDFDNQLWMFVSLEQLGMCNKMIDNVCDFPIQWRQFVDSQCIPSLISDKISLQSIGGECQIELLYKKSSIETLPISPNHWENDHDG